MLIKYIILAGKKIVFLLKKYVLQNFLFKIWEDFFM